MIAAASACMRCPNPSPLVVGFMSVCGSVAGSTVVVGATVVGTVVVASTVVVGEAVERFRLPQAPRSSARPTVPMATRVMADRRREVDPEEFVVVAPMDRPR